METYRVVQKKENAVVTQCYLSNARQKSEALKTPTCGHFLSFPGLARSFHHVVYCLDAQVTRGSLPHMRKVKKIADE